MYEFVVISEKLNDHTIVKVMVKTVKTGERLTVKKFKIKVV